MSSPIKVLTYGAGLTTLTDYVKQVKRTSDANTSDVTTLQNDLQELASQAAGALTEMGSCIEALNARGTLGGDLTLNPSGWELQPDGRFRIFWAVEGCTAQHYPIVSLSNDSEKEASVCGVSRGVETVEGGVYFWANQIPTKSITGTAALIYITSPTPTTT